MVTLREDRKNGWRGYWRGTPVPSAAVPCGARSVGRAEVRKGWRHGAGTIHWVNFYWGICGGAGFVADGRKYVLPEGTLLLNPPETRITGFPIEKAGKYRWLTIDGPEAISVVRGFGLPIMEICPAGKCPEHLFDRLEDAVREITLESEYRASSILYEILSLAAAGLHQSVRDELPPFVEDALLIINDNVSNPDFSVKYLAAMLGKHRSLLSRTFHHFVGMSPSAYLRRVRLQQAYTLLQDRSLSISDVALRCGFSDAAYFSRCVKLELGRSPLKLRGRT